MRPQWASRPFTWHTCNSPRDARCLAQRALLLLWDGLRSHSSALVHAYRDTLGDHIEFASLPPYSADRNPVEYLAARLKRHALANYCTNHLTELRTTAGNRIESARERPSLIAA